MRRFCALLTISVFGVLGSGVIARAQSSSSPNIPPSATGKVIGPDSKPQPGVPLEVTGPEGKTTAFTDQNGQWSLYNLKPGDYSVKPVTPMASDQNTTADFKIIGKGWFDGSKSTYDAGDLKLSRSWQLY
jgi:hypothetical protein